MNFQEMVVAAWDNELCIDFYSNTITDPDGNSWYWQGVSLEAFKQLLEEVLEEYSSRVDKRVSEKLEEFLEIN